MIRDIISDQFLLSRMCQPCHVEDSYDQQIIQDLKDTLNHQRQVCVGMAANMIGECKRMIAFIEKNGDIIIMCNPSIITYKQPYKTIEGCLSLKGQKETTRYQQIKVSWIDEHGKPKIKTYKDFIAQIIQHEIDHCNGILI